MPKEKRPTKVSHYTLASQEDLQRWLEQQEVDTDNQPRMSKRNWKFIVGGTVLIAGLIAAVFPIAALGLSLPKSIATSAPGAGIFAPGETSSIVDTYETDIHGETRHEQTFKYTVSTDQFTRWKDRFRDYQTGVFRDEPNQVNLTVSGPKHSLTLENYTGSPTDQERIRDTLSIMEEYASVPEYKNVSFTINLAEERAPIRFTLNTIQTFQSLDAALRRAYLLLEGAPLDKYLFTVTVKIDSEPTPVPVSVTAQVPDEATRNSLIQQVNVESTLLQNIMTQFGAKAGTEAISYAFGSTDAPSRIIITGDLNATYVNEFDQAWRALNPDEYPTTSVELRQLDDSLEYGNWLP